MVGITVICCAAFLPMGSFAQERVSVTVVLDGLPDRLKQRNTTYVDELLALTTGEFDVRIEHFTANWNHQSIRETLDRAYDDAGIDMVLVTGFVGNQVAAERGTYPRPTSSMTGRNVGLGRYRNICAHGHHEHVRTRVRDRTDIAGGAGPVFPVVPGFLHETGHYLT
jgi:hypothetical protein